MMTTLNITNAMMMIYHDHLKDVLCVQHGACVFVWLRFGFSLITFLIGTKPPSLHTFLNHSHLYNIDTNRQTKLSMILLLTIFIARMQNCNSGFGLMNISGMDAPPRGEGGGFPTPPAKMIRSAEKWRGKKKVTFSNISKRGK